MKRIIVIETNEPQSELKKRIETALLKGKETVETIEDYPFEGHFRPDYLDFYNEVTFKVDNDYEEENLNEKQTIEIAEKVMKEFSEDDYVNGVRSELIDDAIYKLLNQNNQSAQTTFPNLTFPN